MYILDSLLGLRYYIYILEFSRMKLEDLLSLVPPKILNRGHDYFENGNILELNQDQKGTWYAEVEGNYGNYEVEIEIDSKGNLGGFCCDCPYDEQLCKHIAAVALAISENNAITITPIEKPTNDDWKQLIQNAKVDELRRFMLDFGINNVDFRHQVELNFSQPETVQTAINIDYYLNQISGIFEAYDYDGYLDYRSSHGAMRDVNQYLYKADKYYNKGNLTEAFSIAAAITMEAVNEIQHMDDSSGECGAAVYESFQMIDNVLDNTKSEELQKSIFEWLYQQIQNPDYNSYGIGDHLDPLFFKTVIFLKQYDLAHPFIEEQIRQVNNKDSWSRRYHTERYLTYKIELLQSEGRIMEADEIIDNNLQFEEIRQMRVKQFVNKNKLEKAEKLILEGIKIATEEDLPGVVHNWKDQLLDLYKQQNKIKEYNNLARELFIENTSDIKYFRNFKQSTSKDNWAERRDELISELKNKKRGYFNGIAIDDLAQIYIEEQLFDDLFKLVSKSKSINTIIRYTKYLKEDYSDDLIKMYEVGIYEFALQTGRNVYVELVQYLKKMTKLKGGLKAAKDLRESLLNKYKNRPAMKDEFNKLNWN